MILFLIDLVDYIWLRNISLLNFFFIVFQQLHQIQIVRNIFIYLKINLQLRRNKVKKKKNYIYLVYKIK